MNFILYGFEKKDDVENAMVQIEQAGWGCKTYYQEDEPDKSVIECQKKSYIVNQEKYVSDIAFFHRMADLHNGRYDGWFASN